MATDTNQILSEELLNRFLERAPVYDRENRFFTEDFEELKTAGFLTMSVPQDMGGRGMNLAQTTRQTRRLAYYAPATALGTNMHNYWVGVAANVRKSGDSSLDWMLSEAAAGEVFAAGHAEGGNDLPVLLSTTNAEKVDGGYRFTGHKNFGSLTPVWTRLGIHGMDTSDPNAPKIVHAFLPRDTAGYTINEVWDVLGMRATASQDTVMNGAVVPDKYIARVVPAGAAGIDQFVISIFAWALLGFANVYYGMARRAIDLTVEAVKTKTSLGMSRPMSYHAEVQHSVAEMVIEYESIGPHLDKIAQDWSDGVDYGAEWGSKIVAAKYHAVEASWKIIDTAMELMGGVGIFHRAGFERLWRDARLGRLHPTNSALTHEFVAKTALGINPDESPRWG